jgi:hypothetical protein
MQYPGEACSETPHQTGKEPSHYSKYGFQSFHMGDTRGEATNTGPSYPKQKPTTQEFLDFLSASDGIDKKDKSY